MSESNSTKRPKQDKPERPEGSPLFWHVTGRWAKKIRGRHVYFGRGSHDEALADYELQKAELHAGRRPRNESGALTVQKMFEKFLTAKMAQRDAGELAPRTLSEYGTMCKRMLKVFGRNRTVADLHPDDFAELRRVMAKTLGPVKLKGEIIRCRVPFNFAYKQQWISTPIVFGEGFKVPSAKTIRSHKAKSGPKMFTRDEILKLLDEAGEPMRAMIMLGLNAAYGNFDVSTLPLDALDLDGGWVNFARPKTGIDRRCPLWPETVDSIREAIERRHAPTDEADAGLVFITKYGKPFVRSHAIEKGSTTVINGVTQEFGKLLKRVGINGHRGFYCLRHGFQSIGDECGDFIAVRTLMGHLQRRHFRGPPRARFRRPTSQSGGARPLLALRRARRRQGHQTGEGKTSSADRWIGLNKEGRGIRPTVFAFFSPPFCRQPACRFSLIRQTTA